MTDERLDAVEQKVERIVVILEGKPVLDIAGKQTGTEGGLVLQGTRNAEALHIINHKLDGLLPRRWTVTQRISASMVVVVALGSVSTIVWMS